MDTKQILDEYKDRTAEANRVYLEAKREARRIYNKAMAALNKGGK